MLLSFSGIVLAERIYYIPVDSDIYDTYSYLAPADDYEYETAQWGGKGGFGGGFGGFGGVGYGGFGAGYGGFAGGVPIPALPAAITGGGFGGPGFGGPGFGGPGGKKGGGGFNIVVGVPTPVPTPVPVPQLAQPQIQQAKPSYTVIPETVNTKQAIQVPIQTTRTIQVPLTQSSKKGGMGY